MRLSQSVLTDIQMAGQQALPREACGLVVWQEGVQVYVPLRNIATTHDQFHIDPADMLPYLLEKGAILCFCHSHPTTSAIPSVHDVAGYTYDYPHLIYSVRDDEMRLYYVEQCDWQETWRVRL
jgi:proteasome lid subunit RPN8/RPN11